MELQPSAALALWPPILNSFHPFGSSLKQFPVLQSLTILFPSKKQMIKCLKRPTTLGLPNFLNIPSLPSLPF